MDTVIGLDGWQIKQMHAYFFIGDHSLTNEDYMTMTLDAKGILIEYRCRNGDRLEHRLEPDDGN